MVAAPWRSKAASASLFPAPMPPVTATASGLLLLRFVGSCGRFAFGVARPWLVGSCGRFAFGVARPWLLGSDRVGLDARLGRLGFDLRLGSRDVRRRLGDRSLRGRLVGRLFLRPLLREH